MSNTYKKRLLGEKHRPPMEGIEILWDLKKVSDKEYEDGKILNPKNGKEYDCFISLVEPNKLKVRATWVYPCLARPSIGIG